MMSGERRRWVLLIVVASLTMGCAERDGEKSEPAAEASTQQPTLSTYASVEELVDDLEPIIPCGAWEVQADWLAVCDTAPSGGADVVAVMTEAAGAAGILAGLDRTEVVEGANWVVGIKLQSGATLDPSPILDQIADELGAERPI